MERFGVVGRGGDQMVVEERADGLVRGQFVGAVGEAVAFVGVDVVADFDAAFA